MLLEFMDLRVLYSLTSCRIDVARGHQDRPNVRRIVNFNVLVDFISVLRFFF